MRAIFIAVGSEMLELGRVDTNSIWVGQKLMERGILLDMKITAGDNLENLAWVVKNACKRAQLVVITGGLGPTEDDLTREAVSTALNRELIFREEIVENIKQRFSRRGITMPAINTRQAFVIDGAELLANTVGSAPGQYIDHQDYKVLLLPGPPAEMKAMFEKIFNEKIAPLSNYFTFSRSFKFAGITESETDAKIAELYAKYKNPNTTILAAPGLIEVHLLGRSKKTVEEARDLTNELAEKIRKRMADYLVTEEDLSLEEVVLEELKKRKLSLAVAESCSGGGLGSRITGVPGSSEVFMGGVIAYSNEIKQSMLGVQENTLEKKGAVSKEVAAEMANGVRQQTGADIGVSITGIAGPGGASPGKPLGLVFMHLSAEDREEGFYQIFPGDRRLVRTRSVNYTLNLIRKYLVTSDG